MLRRQFVFAIAIVAGCCARVNAAPAEDGNAVLRWNRIASEIVPAVAGPIVDSRVMAILHAAIHDTVNGIERRYRPYTADLSSPAASLDAAVARAARDVMMALARAQDYKIQEEYAAALARVPDGPAKERGLMLGAQAARANLERRARDGVPPGRWPPLTGPIAEPPYKPSGKPGDYAFTPPFDAPPLGPVALFPGWGRLAPFAIRLDVHRLPGPDPLVSARYARDFNRLKSVGSRHSLTRNAEQTKTAFFWFESEPMWNGIARGVIERQALDPWRSAHILALVNFALADGCIASFEAKYRFRFWRPYTAIRGAAEDGNDATQADPEWVPLLWTLPGTPPKFLIPPVPDYPSTAAVTSAAAAEVLRAHLGEEVRFELTSESLPGVTRRFASFEEAAREAGWSRVYGGIHFIRAVEDGLAQGRGIGRVVAGMLPHIRQGRPR
jgi:hypothetical protein